jgi:hypothetical protein
MWNQLWRLFLVHAGVLSRTKRQSRISRNWDQFEKSPLMFVVIASLWGISLKFGEMLQIMRLIIFHSGGEKSAPALSSEKIPLKIERGHGKSQWPPLSYSDPALIKWFLNEFRPLFIQKYLFFFWPPSCQKYSIFWSPRGCRMCVASILMRELNIREQFQVSITQSIISAKNQPNLIGPKLRLLIQWDLVRRFFRTNDDYPDDSEANIRLPKSNQV